jgi:hypothetical protein
MSGGYEQGIETVRKHEKIKICLHCVVRLDGEYGNVSPFPRRKVQRCIMMFFEECQIELGNSMVSFLRAQKI